MKYDFNEVHNRLGTYCTQWDYIQDRFNKKDLIPFSILQDILKEDIIHILKKIGFYIVQQSCIQFLY